MGVPEGESEAGSEFGEWVLRTDGGLTEGAFPAEEDPRKDGDVVVPCQCMGATGAKASLGVNYGDISVWVEHLCACAIDDDIEETADVDSNDKADDEPDQTPSAEGGLGSKRIDE